jgi:hypothetical protein
MTAARAIGDAGAGAIWAGTAGGRARRSARRWLALCSLLVAVASAPAAPARAGAETELANVPVPLVRERPAGWRTAREEAAALAQRFAASALLGGLLVATEAEAYVGKAPGVVLFATRATANLSDEVVPARIVRVALDELRASPQRAVLTGGSPHETAWQERVEPGLRQVAATLAWTDAASHTVETARLVIASDGRVMTAVTGECIASDGADPAAIAACQKALATLDPGIAVAKRVALVPAAAGAAAMSDATAAPSLPARAPRLDDGGRISFPPMVVPPQQRAADRRPVYVGAGLIALALVFWWNRRRRDRFDREELGTPAAQPRGDDDADDLHAAARGEPGAAPGNVIDGKAEGTPESTASGRPRGKEDQP